MHYAHRPTILPAADYARLQRLMLTMIGSRTVLASLLRRKLGSADAGRPSAVAPDIAISGRRVHFRLDGERAEARTLTWQPPKRGDTASLSLLSPRGLALLGLGPGQSFAYRTEADRTEFLEVERVFAQGDDSLEQAEGLPADMASFRLPAPAGVFAGGQNV